MKHSTLFCLAISLLATNTPSVVRAETLDDASIRALYAETTAHLQNSTLALADEKERLAENYLGKITTTTFMNGEPINNEDKEFTKSQSIASTLEGAKHIHINDVQNTIKDIQFSTDNATASVSNTTSSSGIMNLSLPNHQTSQTHFEMGQGCVDQLTLINSKIQIVKSDCLLNIYLKRDQ